MSEYIAKCNEVVGISGKTLIVPDYIDTSKEIVRCRDCVHKRRSWNGHEPNFIGNWFCSYTGGHEVKPDGFCAWGERKGGDEPPYAEGGTVSETYIDSGESDSICPIPRASVTFEGQKLTFDDEDSAKFAELVKGHFRKLAGLRGDAE